MPSDALKLHGTRGGSSSSNNHNNRDIQQQLSSTATTSQQKVVDIYLANNPYVCNCNMGWLSQLLLASSTMQTSNLNAGLLREHQLILTRQLPRIADAHLVNCHLPFARQSPYTPDPHQWSPVMAANQLALQQHHHANQHSHGPSAGQVGGYRHVDSASSSALIARQSDLLASVHLCPYKSHCFALCYCCDFDACDCEMSCPENCSCYYDQTWSTNIVDCSANNQINSGANSTIQNPSRLKPSAGQYNLQQHHHHHQQQAQPVFFDSIPEKIPMDVTELYLDGLYLRHLKGNALIGRKNLISLYLNNSQVQSIEPRAFATQKSLKVLQLNSNALTELHGYEFESQIELRELYLANNRLVYIANTTFANLKSLQILHLQNNQLYHLNFWANLPSGHKLVSLSVGSNPWSCQCEHIESMLQWLHVNVRHLIDRKSVTCQYNRTSSLHLLTPLINSDLMGGSSGDDAQHHQQQLSAYNSLNDNYAMFDMRMCLNHTVYPLIGLPSTASPVVVTTDSDVRLPSQQPRSPTENEADALNANLPNFQSPIYPPNDQPYPGQPTLAPMNNIWPPEDWPHTPIGANNSKSLQWPISSVLFALILMALLVVLLISLVHYRRFMGSWFYGSRYGLKSMFSATGKAAHGHHAGTLAGSMDKHSQLHQRHQFPHHHHYLHQCSGGGANVGGGASTGSTGSSSAASSNISQSLFQQQQQQLLHQQHLHQQQQQHIHQSATTNRLVTTPLIVSKSHHHHPLLASSSNASTATTSPYNDPEKLYDAYVTYSKLDEQFVNDFIAPQLEYGQSSYR